MISQIYNLYINFQNCFYDKNLINLTLIIFSKFSVSTNDFLLVKTKIRIGINNNNAINIDNNTGIHIGEKTHNQDQLITPVNFKIVFKNYTQGTPSSPSTSSESSTSDDQVKLNLKIGSPCLFSYNSNSTSY